MIGSIVYVLCAISSVMCAWVLYRSYNGAKSALLLWSSLCFVMLAIGNVMLFVDLVLVGPNIDLSMPRTFVTIAGFGLLLYGLIWETV
jgi:hypothetical protein